MINFPLSEICLESVDSTNNYLKRILKEDEPPFGISVMTKVQTFGRGRLGRSWQSSQGSLCMSIAVKNQYAEGFTLLVALAVYEALKPFCKGKPLQIKWPNDIICENKKLCGILCERASEYTVIGIGINVNDKEFFGEIKDKATSLYLLTSRKLDVKDVFTAVNTSFEKLMTEFDFTFSPKAREEYKTLCANIGKEVKTEKYTGIATDIDERGGLLVKTEEETISLTSGEVAVHGIY